MNYTKIKSTDFIEVIMAKLGAGYVYGTIWTRCTIWTLKECYSRLKNKVRANYYEKDGDFTKGACARWVGHMVCDCTGLVESSYSKITKSKLDLSAQGFYDSCKNKDFKRDLVAGDAVFIRGKVRIDHIGIYLGNGKVIESRGVDYGVVVTDYKGRGWTNHGELPFIEYVNEKTEIETEIDKAVELGILTSPGLWVDVLKGNIVANKDYLLLVFKRYNELLRRTKS